MKIIYSCDLHGDTSKYEELKKLILLEACDAVVIGGDLLKYTAKDVDMQIEFVNNYLAKFLESVNIPVYLIKGNTDCSVAFNALKTSVTSNVKCIDETPARINGMYIFGFDLINPSPFKIKNYERRDLACENVEFSPILIRMNNGELQIKPSGYLNYLPSIEEELLKYKNISNNIFVCHVPPFGTKLDIDSTGNHVGSKAVYEFILQRQPLLMLCGHIHESPTFSNNYMDYIGKTLCVNPGQDVNLSACVIRIESDIVLDCKISNIKTKNH